jgi:outer membrane protein TolC
MRFPDSRRSCLALGVALAGCADGAQARQHDSMVATISRAESDHAHHGEISDAALVVDGRLDRSAVVAAVLARNPDLDAARAAWRAAVAGYPSAVALDDPMARYALAPLGIGSSLPFGQRIEVSQKLPWPGRRQRRGDSALADAEAARADIEVLRLDLAEAAIDAFDDDYIATRALEINQHHRELLERIENSVIAQYTAGRASQQDPLEARTHIIELDRERLMLETQRRAAVATLNRLLHRRAGAELAPPVLRAATATTTTPPAAVSGEPSREHPGRVAAEARLRARRAEAEDARLAFYPSFEVMGSYDSMWDAWQHRWMIGVGVEIPLQREKRGGDVERARAEQARAAAELAAVADRLDEARARARDAVEESTRALDLYQAQLLPTARQRVDAALAGFSTGQNPFSAVVMAEHQLRDVELAIERARADLDRHLAALERAEGRIPGAAR